MNDYLVELFVSKANEPDVAAGTNRARTAAAALTREGSAVHCVSSMFVPDDETWLLLFRAESSEIVRQAALRAGLLFDRITEVRMSTAARRRQAVPAELAP